MLKATLSVLWTEGDMRVPNRKKYASTFVRHLSLTVFRQNRAYNPVRRFPATIKSSKSAGQQTECKRRTSSPKTFNFRDLPAGAGTCMYIQTDFQSFLDGIPPRTPSAKRTSRTENAFNFWDSPPTAATQHISTQSQASSIMPMPKISSFDFGSELLPRPDVAAPAIPFRPWSRSQFEAIPESSTMVPRPIQNLPSCEISASFCFTALLPSRPDNLFKLLASPQVVTLPPSAKTESPELAAPKVSPNAASSTSASLPLFSTSSHAGLGLAALLSARN
ncbi:hypothetical protein C8F04DRAFT_1368049 [Mycena alexandri]|uniref:Uncharacterized protein n=1 Tax=Mycena alexandri TaxID=1745969 RepID=A0AAD6X0B4_9AGAR|nr:hypothetical protein C8F04DRAFT_1368049 [Mycena alexandri]